MATISEIQTFLQSNPGLTDAQIAAAMDQYGVTPAQMAVATGVSVNEVQGRYEAAGGQTYNTSTGTAAPMSEFERTLQAAVANRDAGIRTLPAATPAPAFTSQQIADYIRGLQTQGRDNAFIAAEMDRFGVNPTRVASALTLSAQDVQNLYNQVRPSGTFATSQTGTSTTGGGTTGFTSQQIADYIRGLQAQGRDNTFIAAEMDRFNVNPSQVASALNLPLADVQNLYNQVRPSGLFFTTPTKTTTPITTTTTTPLTFDAGVTAALARPKYEDTKFTGKTGIGTITPPTTYQNLALLGGQVAGAPKIIGLPAPDVYAGVPAALPRPATNVAPTGFSAQDVLSDMAPIYNAGAITSKKAGGLASLADKVQSAGRNGDTMLAHINPREAGILQALGGSGTINPRTGLPEFFSFRDIEKGIRRVGRSIDRRITQPVIGELNNLAERLGPVGQLAAMYFGGPIGAGIYAGFAAPGDDFNVKRAAQAAALTYAGGQLGQSMSGAPVGGANPMSAADYSAAVDSIDAAAGATLTPPPGPSAMISADPNAIAYTPNPASYVGGAPAMGQTAMLDNPVVSMTDAAGNPIVRDTAGNAVSITNQLTTADKAYEATRPFMDRAGDYLSNVGSKALDYAVKNPFPAALYATMGTSLIQGQREREEFKEEEKREAADLEERRRRYREQAEGIMSRYPLRFAARGGMLDDIDDPRDEVGYGMAGGGMPPRFLSGGGDGMSDSIPAVIANKQPARLADGEFVIPADVVSHLGNGSSKAGAKQLYAMMDRIRKARTGTTKQGREVKPRQFMPA